MTGSRSRIALVAVATLQAGSALAVEPAPPSVPTTSLPSEVAAYVERRTGCNHWGGEEAYDAERAREIAAAVRTLDCDRLDADETRLRQRYRRAPEVLKALDAEN